jgi:hypothetical protein
MMIDGEPLEYRLLRMPFNQMLDALEAINDLDELLLEQLKSEGCVDQLTEWRQKVISRKQVRQQFIEFRIALECGAHRFH